MKDFGFGNDNSKHKERSLCHSKKNSLIEPWQIKGNLNASSNKPYYPNNKKVICFYCKKLGHMSLRTIVKGLPMKRLMQDKKN
jgi:hypothetical protein